MSKKVLSRLFLILPVLGFTMGGAYATDDSGGSSSSSSYSYSYAPEKDPIREKIEKWKETKDSEVLADLVRISKESDGWPEAPVRYARFRPRTLKGFDWSGRTGWCA
jgi:hypothetical protein